MSELFLEKRGLIFDTLELSGCLEPQKLLFSRCSSAKGVSDFVFRADVSLVRGTFHGTR